MNRLQIYRSLYEHNKLKSRRSPIFEQNTVAKVFVGIGAAFTVLYLVFIAIILSLSVNGSSWIEGYEMMFAILPFILALDFLLRFMLQQTPTQLIHPYLILPMPKRSCIEAFLIFSMLSGGNLIWLALFVPFSIMSVLFQTGVFHTLSFLISLQLFIVMNSLFYNLCRTLISNNILWWAVPISVYALIFTPWILNDIGYIFEFYAHGGEFFTYANPLAYLCLLCVLILLFLVNIKIQGYYVYKEVSGQGSKQLKRVSTFNFLNRFGETGEFLKLEIKSIMRNKNVRSSFVIGTIITGILSLIIAYTDIYSDSFSSKFWLVYVFVLYGAITLVKVMGYEGNYIDGLMVHKENILALLRTKYYFYISLLAFPMLLMLPTVFSGKYTLLQLVSIALFTAGPEFCILMQMAVYNRQSIPLNTKIIAKGSVETNWLPVVAEFVVMFLPVIIISILSAFFSDLVTYIILLTTGMLFIVFHEVWLRNIYRRFMARRYVNMDSFRA
ncbi:MAG: DUF5687 family protein [Prevotella sp.]|uniref:DUF5687 family protein n=1 Tax=Prevotella sp. TaxID=59823 RepID=UPI002A27B2AD|nr:DUF5687 family protein [Prevotella sp.]MDD7318192.1 DUF5687 family protein [Prevotellaceae bacterium]MDY4020919.1 DUF5687 family protein [Prevotella sp.]